MNEELTLEFTGDYKEKLIKLTTQLEKMSPHLSREQRKSLVVEITDAYVAQVGKRPDGSILYRMGNVILREELSDRHPDKMTRDEYPIMSERQQVRRREGKERSRRKDGVVIRETPLKHASNVATDGKDYTLPIRSFRNPN